MILLRDFLRLVRVVNLLYIVMTMYFVRHFLIAPFSENQQLGEFDFFLLVISTLLITASGYIINDYFDVKIDVVNRGGDIVIDKSISRRTAMLLHQLFNISATLLGFYVAWQADQVWLGLIQIFSITILWFYSTTFKRQAVIGNLVVSFLSALVVLVVFLFEINSNELGNEIRNMIFLYAVFAFIITWVREIVKDMEDIDGDRTENCRTMPIAFGIKAAKLSAVIISIFVMILIAVVILKHPAYSGIHNNQFVLSYIFLAVILPWMISCYMITRADSPKQFHQVSNLIKYIMLSGILSMPLFYMLNN